MANARVTPARIAELVAVHSLTFAVAAPLLQVLFFGHRPRRELISGACCCWPGALATVIMAPDWSRPGRPRADGAGELRHRTGCLPPQGAALVEPSPSQRITPSSPA